MCLTRSALAVFDPLLDGPVLIPGIVSGEDLDSRHVGLVEDLVLFVKESDRLFGCLILVNTGLDLVEERGLLLDIMMSFNDICVSGWKSLDIFQVLLMSLFVNPWILNLDVLWLECLVLFLGQQRWLAIVLLDLLL